MGMIQHGVNQIIAGLGAAAVAGEARKAREETKANQVSREGYEIAQEGLELKSNELAPNVSPTAAGNEKFEEVKEYNLDEAAWDVRASEGNLENLKNSPIDKEQFFKEHARDKGKFRKKEDIKNDYYEALSARSEQMTKLQNDVEKSKMALDSLVKQYEQLSNQRKLFQMRLENFNKERTKLSKKGYNIPEVKEK